MLQKLALLAVLVAAGSGAYVATSSATSKNVGLPPDVTANALAPVSVSADQQIAIQNAIGADTAAAFGISDASYGQVRQLSTTSVGPLYVVPGSAGECLVLADAVSCGSAGGGHDPAVAVFHSDASGNYVGGGVITNKIHEITLTDYSGASATASLTRGGFTIDGLGVKAGPTLQINYR
jgi:hypothetical protein